MKDVEHELYTIVAKALREQYADIFVTGEPVNAPPKFPCVSFYEDDNYTSRDDLDSSSTEKFVVMRYRVDVYTNDASGKKDKAKDIMSVIEPILYLKDFTRFSRTPLNDLGDKIYHLVATYRVKFDGDAFYRV